MLRGIAFLTTGSVAKAQADFKQANDINQKYAYASIWLDLTERRNNIPSHLAEMAQKLDMKEWPAPVVKLLLGEFSPEQTLAAANDKNAKTQHDQICEANLYSGELALIKNAKDEAIRLFKLAAKDCPHSFIEWDAAIAELKTLGILLEQSGLAGSHRDKIETVLARAGLRENLKPQCSNGLRSMVERHPLRRQCGAGSGDLRLILINRAWFGPDQCSFYAQKRTLGFIRGMSA
jgi:hypothetical protein